MRPLVVDPRVLRNALRDLESTGDEAHRAVTRVEVPQDGYPWQGLVDRGVATLLRDTVRLVGACRRTTGALEDSLHDFEELDGHVADAAGERR